MRRRVLIIANPAAGGGRRRGRRRLARVVAALEQRGCAVAVRRSGPAVGDAERLAREAEADFDIVVAAGGDGTLNAVVNGLAATPRPVALLPFGTANLLARELGLPRRPELLAELIVNGRAQPVWPGRVGDRLFLTVASSGLDAAIVAAVDPRLKRRFGRLAFAWAVLVHLPRYRGGALTVRADGTDYRVGGAIAAKGRFYAGRFAIAPDADIAEPTLDLVLLCRSGRLAMLRYVWALLRGRLAGRRDLLTVRTRSAWLAADNALPVQADGEPVGHLPVRLGVAERPVCLVGRLAPRAANRC